MNNHTSISDLLSLLNGQSQVNQVNQIYQQPSQHYNYQLQQHQHQNQQVFPVPFQSSIEIPPPFQIPEIVHPDKDAITKLVTKLVKEQSEMETRLLERYAQLQEKIKKQASDIDALEIVGGNRLITAQTDLEQTHQQLNEYRGEMFRAIEKLAHDQQRVLEGCRVPCFKVSDDPVVLADQMWVLAPYLEYARKNGG